MEPESKTVITVQSTINAAIEKVWAYWTEPAHIMQWNNASPDWHCPKAENDLKTGGKFSFTMAAKDESFSFDFSGVYDTVDQNELIEYTMDDGRKAQLVFTADGNETTIVESFEAETQNPEELQRGGWQAILDNFKKHTETT